jgi:soluble lytic murein transglycosylase-like protein
MLHSSLSLTGSSSAEASALTQASPFTSANSIIQAYRANISADEGAVSVAPKQMPSQLQDFNGDLPAVESSAANVSRSNTDSSWLDHIISKASNRYGVDAGLIKAVIKAESDFNPQAVSHAGARGLMQLMPSTARSLGVNDSFDPEQNVMGGTRFLKDMLQRYNGNVDSALAAYNWGPGNVDKRPDHLPRETRDYLVRVKQLYATYNG